MRHMINILLWGYLITCPVYCNSTPLCSRIAAHKLNALVMSQLRQILSVKWWHFISNMQILRKTNMYRLYNTLIQRSLRWAGHINRLDNNRIPKLVLYSQLVEGSRGIGRPRLRFKDTIKRNLRDRELVDGKLSLPPSLRSHLPPSALISLPPLSSPSSLIALRSHLPPSALISLPPLSSPSLRSPLPPTISLSLW